MTPDERELIKGLFERMRDYGAPEKDREAETLINQSVRAIPDAPYMLVQSVLVQEQALQAANDRVLDLEARVRELEGGERPSRGFLGGGLFGGRAAPETRGSSSVPAIGSRSAPSSYERPSSPWSQGPQAAGPQAQQQAPSASGGFMKSALATAAGVAGGMLVADSIRNMMGSAHANPAAATPAASSSGSQDAGNSASERDNDPGTYDASDNDPGYDSSSDFGGDLDI